MKSPILPTRPIFKSSGRALLIYNIMDEVEYIVVVPSWGW